MKYARMAARIRGEATSGARPRSRAADRGQDGALALSIAIDDDGIPRITRLMASPARTASPGRRGAGGRRPPEPPAAVPAVPSGLPLADLLTPGTGRRGQGPATRSRCRAFGCATTATPTVRTGSGGRYASGSPTQTGLRTEVFLRLLTGQGAVRAWTRITNDGHEPVTIDAVSSFLCGGLPVADGIGSPDDLDVMWAENEWLAEGRWQHRGFRDAVPDTDRVLHPANPRRPSASPARARGRPAPTCRWGRW